MQNIITYSPFISSCVLFAGIHYENWFLLITGFILMILSFFGLLCQCGSDFREEIERANMDGK